MKNLSKKQRFSLSLLSGILLGISFPYTGSLFFLSFVAFVPLLILEDYITTKNYRSGKVFVHAYLTFFLFNLITTWWIYYASAGGMVMAVFANSLLMAIAFYLFHLTKKHLGKKEGYLGLVIYWIAFEYLHFHWELSWPWLNLGNVFARVPALVQWYQYCGILGGTIWILVVNLFALRIAKPIFAGQKKLGQQKKMFVTFFFFLLVPMGYSLVQYFTYTEEVHTENVVILQPNIDPYNTKFSTPLKGQIEKTLGLAKGKVSAHTDLVLAPETTLSYEFYEDNFRSYDFYAPLYDEVKKWNCDFLLGASTIKTFEKKNSSASRAFTDGPGFWESYNTSLLMRPDESHEFVHKSKLVLGVEKVPFIKYLPFIDKWSIEQGGASGTLGISEEPMIFKGKNGYFAPVVCYESVYGELVSQQVRKGAEYIAVITNDGWWRDTPGYKQHLAFARLRAVENRRSVARSANTGTSAIINQRGDIMQQTGWWEATSIVGTLNRNKELTVYSKYGDFFGRSFTFVAALLLLVTWVRRFKKKYGMTPTK